MDKQLSISLHLGAHKTASTHLQQSLQRVPDALLNAQVRFFGPRVLRDPEQPLVKLVRSHGADADPTDGSDVLYPLAEGVAHLVLSDENLLGQVMNEHQPGKLYPRAKGRITRLLTGLRSAHTTVFLSIRDPGAWLASLYSQRIKGGQYTGFEEFCAGLVPTEVLWSGLIRRLAQIGGHRGIVVWRYEDYAQIGDQVLESLLGRVPPIGVKLLDRRINSSISEAAIDHLLTRFHDGGVMPDDWAKAAQAKFPLSKAYPAFDPWSDEEKKAIRHVYLDDIERIKNMPNVTFLEPV